ncbi:MAG: hypothetical protein AAGF67_02015, partial [Verrucomicrobiota bacterium]
MKTVFVLFSLFFAPFIGAAEFHVATDGVDDPNRDGLSRKTAWASLAFACEQLPESEETQTIRIHPGVYETTRTAFPKSNTKIVGGGRGGKDRSELIASKDWKLSSEFKPDAPPEKEHLIAFRKQENITVKDLALHSDPEHRITGGILATASNQLHFENLSLKDFRWNGIFLNV